MFFLLRKKLLKQAGDDRQSLSRLLTGSGIFFLGMGLIFYSEHFAPQALLGELTALAGLAFAIFGGGIAAFGYIGLSVVRILRFLKNDD